ncbi:MAG TPA: molybdopterin molybdotransferase MoeA [Parvularculaceae bacterium]|nr:molybdopterin molybdotransferase MoeA [Parvularculaceae bacterium]
MKKMISVDEAQRLLCAGPFDRVVETVRIGEACGRILAKDVLATIDQPPFRASAMDGYAVRFEDAQEGARLRLAGEAAAGAPFDRALAEGEAVRIFTGGAAPDGADHVVIQEDTARDGDHVIITAPQAKPSNIRSAGVDFRRDDVLKRAGERLSPIDLGLIAAANIASVGVLRKPIVAYFDNGDELREPGAALPAGAIVGSNRFALDALIREWGGEARYLGRAADDAVAIREKFQMAQGAEIIVTVGGASVGDHDYVKSSFEECGGDFVFSKIAMKPGKPTWFGRLGRARVLGLPGNPASAIVCAILFLKPLVAAAAGCDSGMRLVRALLSAGMAANGARESYVRGALAAREDGVLIAAPNAREDSSLYSPLAGGNCLIRRPAHAGAAEAGEIVDCIIYRAPFPS